jgi:hypothetical protein
VVVGADEYDKSVTLDWDYIRLNREKWFETVNAIFA